MGSDGIYPTWWGFHQPLLWGFHDYLRSRCPIFHGKKHAKSRWFTGKSLSFRGKIVFFHGKIIRSLGSQATVEGVRELGDMAAALSAICLRLGHRVEIYWRRNQLFGSCRCFLCISYMDIYIYIIYIYYIHIYLIYIYCTCRYHILLDHFSGWQLQAIPNLYMRLGHLRQSSPFGLFSTSISETIKQLWNYGYIILMYIMYMYNHV